MKQRFFKKNLKNVKNLTKSLAKTHQLAIAYHWEHCPIKGIESGPVSKELLSDLENNDFISEQLHIDLSSEVTVTPWVKCHGTEYRIGLVVCLDLVEDAPVFGKIVTIFIKDGIFFWHHVWNQSLLNIFMLSVLLHKRTVLYSKNLTNCFTTNLLIYKCPMAMTVYFTSFWTVICKNKKSNKRIE